MKQETLDFIFDHVKGAPADYHQVWASLDSKAANIFGVGSAVVGLAGFSVTKAESTSVPVAIILGVALVAYGTALIAALVHLWPAEARHASYGDTLWRDAWNQEVVDIKHGIVEDIAEGSEQNKDALVWKAKTLRVIVAAVGAETLLIGAAFIVRLLAG